MDRELFERVLKVLNWSVPYIRDDTLEFEQVKKEVAFRIKQLKVQEEFYDMPKESRDKIRMANKMNWYARNDETTRKFEEARKLVEGGLSVRQACIRVDMWPTTYAKRMKSEQNREEWLERRESA
jgi:hypothetical protein